jgi:hypothetical protein
MLPQRQPWEMAQTTWGQALNPIIANPLVQGQLLTGIPLVTGSNVINHKLGRKLQGWIIVGVNAVANIYDSQASNQTPQLTLNLTSDAVATVNLWVF